MSAFRYTRPDSFPPVIKNLLIINVLVFVAQLSLDSRMERPLTDILALYPIIPGYPIIPPNNTGFNPYQLITYMFAHGNFAHILFNMFALWMFGRILENVWGGKRFLFFYIVCGIGAAIFHLAIQYYRGGPFAGALGASGAIMGIMAAFGYLFPNTELMIIPIPIPIKAKWLVLGYIALDLFGGFSNTPGDNIAHFAHLGGAIVGFILVYIWNKTNRKTLF